MKKARDEQKIPVGIYQTTMVNEAGDLVICKELVVVFESWRAIDAELFGMARNTTRQFVRKRMDFGPTREFQHNISHPNGQDACNLTNCYPMALTEDEAEEEKARMNLLPSQKLSILREKGL